MRGPGSAEGVRWPLWLVLRYIAGCAEAQTQWGRDSCHETVHILAHLFTAFITTAQGCYRCEITHQHEKKHKVDSWPQFFIFVSLMHIKALHVMCFDPCSALCVSILPSTSLIFSGLFMSQCKLIHVDSRGGEWKVDLRLCGFLSVRHGVIVVCHQRIMAVQSHVDGSACL